jgi:hypothetical protein
MARHIWTVLCSRSIIDTETNNVTLFNIIERVAFTELPEEWPVNLPLSFEIVTLWSRSDLNEPEELEGRTAIEGATESRILGEYRVNLTENYLRFRHRHRVEGIQVTGLGQIWFIVQLRNGEVWEEVARVPLEFSHTPPE